ncbi:PilZ domain-containing protein [Bradyrhizobium sp.]|uniref:PilZ domain-containing protein n=1 Tax=Bradyrhizobium sp. TaxID=376 RepID=UPI004037CAFE
MDSTANRRRDHRVLFSHAIDVQMFAIDGTWRRPCTMLDVSEAGVRLGLKSSIQGLNLKEFFLVLSSTGVAFRRCELAWINGEQIGASFLTGTMRASQTKKASTGEKRSSVQRDEPAMHRCTGG